MAAPVTTARPTPEGIKLDDGYQSLLAFERDPDASFWEKEVQGLGLDNRDPIDTTTMHNVYWMSKAPRQLNEATDVNILCAYDPNVIDDIVPNLLGIPGSITDHVPDGTTIDFFGWLRSFIPEARVEGTQPQANIVIVVSNWDPVNRVEQGPVLTVVAGT